MNPAPDNQRWFALQVRTRWEGSTAVLLSGKGYQTFLPTYKTKKRWKGKTGKSNRPCFPGYVFCQFDAHKRLAHSGDTGCDLRCRSGPNTAAGGRW